MQRINGAAHALSLATKHAITKSSKKCAAYRKTIVGIKKIGRACRYGINGRLQDMGYGTIRNFASTRIDGLVVLVSSFLKVPEEVIQAELEAKNNKSLLEGVNRQAANELRDNLEERKNTTKLFSAEKFSTLNHVLVELTGMLETAITNDDDSFRVSCFKQHMRVGLKKKFRRILTIDHLLATYLDYRGFQDLQTLFKIKRSEMVKVERELKTRLTSLYDKYKTKFREEQKKKDANSLDVESGKIKDSKEGESPRKKRKLNKSHGERLRERARKLRTEKALERKDTVQQEFDDFRLFHDPDSSSDSQFWSRHAAQFPLHYELYKTLACIPASQISTERVFSMMNLIMTARRNRMSPKTLEELVHFTAY